MTMYRKKSETIEAVQWTGDVESIEKIGWVKDEMEKQNILSVTSNSKDKDIMCLISDGFRNGMYKVKKMDYIVKREGGIYIKSAKDFEEMYEPVKKINDLTIKVNLDTTEAEEKINRLKQSMDKVSEICMNAGKKLDITEAEEKIKYLNQSKDNMSDACTGKKC